MAFKCKYIVIFFLALGVSFPAFAMDFDSKRAYRAWVTISKIEYIEGIPSGLLHSMSLVETGGSVSGNVLPWPYTLGVNSPGYKNVATVEELQELLSYYKELGFKSFNLKINDDSHNNIGSTELLGLVEDVENVVELSLKANHFSKKFPSKIDANKFAMQLIAADYDNFDIGMMQINWHYHKDGFDSVTDALDVYRNANYAVSYLRKHRKDRTWWESVGRYHSGTEKHAKKYIRSVWNMYKRIHKLDV